MQSNAGLLTLKLSEAPRDPSGNGRLSNISTGRLAGRSRSAYVPQVVSRCYASFTTGGSFPRGFSSSWLISYTREHPGPKQVLSATFHSGSRSGSQLQIGFSRPINLLLVDSTSNSNSRVPMGRAFMAELSANKQTRSTRQNQIYLVNRSSLRVGRQFVDNNVELFDYSICVHQDSVQGAEHNDQQERQSIGRSRLRRSGASPSEPRTSL